MLVMPHEIIMRDSAQIAMTQEAPGRMPTSTTRVSRIVFPAMELILRRITTRGNVQIAMMQAVRGKMLILTMVVIQIVFPVTQVMPPQIITQGSVRNATMRVVPGGQCISTMLVWRIAFRVMPVMPPPIIIQDSARTATTRIHGVGQSLIMVDLQTARLVMQVQLRLITTHTSVQFAIVPIPGQEQALTITVVSRIVSLAIKRIDLQSTMKVSVLSVIIPRIGKEMMEIGLFCLKEMTSSAV